MNTPGSPGPRDLFARASDRLDAPMAGRLRAARRDALDGRAHRRGWRPWLPAGGLAAAVLALGLAWWLPARPPVQAEATAGVPEDLVFEEDAEFYAWLAEAPVATSGDPL